MPDSINDVANKVKAWLTEGDALRSQLIAEKQGLMARMRDIDKVLSAMPVPRETSLATDKSQSKTLKPAAVSAPDVARQILASASAPMTSTDILKLAEMMYSDIDERNIHSALYRLRKSGAITVQGSKGSMKYSLKKAAA